VQLVKRARRQFDPGPEDDCSTAVRHLDAEQCTLWGAKGVVGQLYDVLATWQEKAVDVRGRALDCGHALQEEASEEVLQELLAFLSANADPLTSA
jgi:haloacetate dehalogenase